MVKINLNGKKMYQFLSVQYIIGIIILWSNMELNLWMFIIVLTSDKEATNIFLRVNALETEQGAFNYDFLFKSHTILEDVPRLYS